MTFLACFPGRSGWSPGGGGEEWLQHGRSEGAGWQPLDAGRRETSCPASQLPAIGGVAGGWAEGLERSGWRGASPAESSGANKAQLGSRGFVRTWCPWVPPRSEHFQEPSWDSWTRPGKVLAGAAPLGSLGWVLFLTSAQRSQGFSPKRASGPAFLGQILHPPTRNRSRGERGEAVRRGTKGLFWVGVRARRRVRFSTSQLQNSPL